MKTDLSALWIGLAVVATIVVYRLFFAQKPTSENREGPKAYAMFADGARAAWIEARSSLDLSTPEKLAKRMELVAASFASVAMKRWSNGRPVPPWLVWSIVIEGVRAAGTEPPSVLREAEEILEALYGPEKRTP